MTDCWLAQFGRGDCRGPLQKAHLIAKQTLRREVIGHPKPKRGWTADEFALLWDERVWVLACELHHGRFDGHRLVVPREALPEPLEAFAVEIGLGHWLDRRYGERGAV